MASTRERAWLAAHQKGSKALVQRLDKAHANNPEYQAFKKKHGLGDTSSVKQVSKSTVDRAKEKARQTLAGKAYGATKGTRMGSAEGTGETLRDTIAPLTRDQHSAVKAAEREAKAAEKPAAAPKKPAKPKKEKATKPEKKKPSALELIAAAAAKRKINQPPVSPKALRRIAAVGDMEHDHGGFEDLGDTQYGGRHSYNEEVKNFKVGDKVKMHTPDDLDWHERNGELISTSDDGHVVKLNDGTKLSATKHQIKKIDEANSNSDMLAASRYGTTTTQAPKGTEKDYQKLLKRQIKNRMGLHRKPNLPEEVEQVDEGMLDDYIEGKIAKHHANKYNPEINAAHADAAEVTKKIKPFNKKIAQIKKRVSYKDKTHKNYAKTRADLKDASASIQPLSAERSKHYDRIRDARNKRDSNTDSDVETYHKWGVVGLGAKKLKQKLTKEEVELSEMDSEGYRGTSEPHHSSYAGKKWVESKPITPEQAVKGASKIFKDILKKQSKPVKEEAEQIDEMKYGIGAVVKLKKPVDGHEYATVKGFTSSGSTSGPTGRGVPMPAGKVKKVKVALRKNDDHSYYAGPVTHIEHDDVHSVIRESAPGWMLRQNPELAKKVKAKIAIAKNRKKQMGNPTPVQEAKKHHMGGALFADTAARLQKAVNAHKERMDQMTNGPEHEYHHPTLDIRTKSRLKFPAPWVKVEDK